MDLAGQPVPFGQHAGLVVRRGERSPGLCHTTSGGPAAQGFRVAFGDEVAGRDDRDPVGS